ncbi:MAG: SagB/ThcOx family dehydrogenase [Candidatus Hydrothermarchaeales archaeon]
MRLPKPVFEGDNSLEEVILGRRSKRNLTGDITDEEISQIMWAAQGITSEDRLRTVPSAGALYPLELYVLTYYGVFRYLPQVHELERIKELDARRDVAKAALKQMFISQAPLVIVISAVFERVTGKYGSRGVRYVHFEAGHVTQNILLQCEALGLKSAPVGAFNDEEVREAIGAPTDHKPLYIISIGR